MWCDVMWWHRDTDRCRHRQTGRHRRQRRHATHTWHTQDTHLRQDVQLLPGLRCASVNVDLVVIRANGNHCKYATTKVIHKSKIKNNKMQYKAKRISIGFSLTWTITIPSMTSNANRGGCQLVFGSHCRYYSQHTKRGRIWITMNCSRKQNEMKQQPKQQQATCNREHTKATQQNKKHPSNKIRLIHCNWIVWVIIY